jgi:hypothetical protein
MSSGTASTRAKIDVFSLHRAFPRRVPPTDYRRVTRCFYAWMATGSSVWTATGSLAWKATMTRSSTRGQLATMTLRLPVRRDHGRGGSRAGEEKGSGVDAASKLSPRLLPSCHHPKPPPPSPPNPPLPCYATMGKEKVGRATRRAPTST